MRVEFYVVWKLLFLSSFEKLKHKLKQNLNKYVTLPFDSLSHCRITKVL